MKSGATSPKLTYETECGSKAYYGNFDEGFGELVKLRRLERNLTQKDLAERVSVSPSSVSRAEAGLVSAFNRLGIALRRALSITDEEIQDLYYKALGLEGVLQDPAELSRVNTAEGRARANEGEGPRGSKTPLKIPEPDPLVTIEANADNKLELQSTFSDDDDRATIEAYRAEFLQILPAEIERYERNDNRPQTGHFSQDTGRCMTSLQSRSKRSISPSSICP